MEDLRIQTLLRGVAHVRGVHHKLAEYLSAIND